MIDLLIYKDTKKFVQKNRHKNSKAVTFVFPVQIYSLELLLQGQEGDAIKVAVKRLLQYYKSHPEARGKDENNNELSNVTMVANTLGVKPKLVEYIIESEEIEQRKPKPGYGGYDGSDDEDDAGEENENEEGVITQKQERFYLAVDCISQKIIDIIDEKSFSLLKADSVDVEYGKYGTYRYHPTLGSSEWEELIRIGQDCAAIWSEPSKDEVICLLQRKYGKRKKLLAVPKVIAEGQYELAVTCYYPATDANNFFVADPFKKKNSLFMKSIIGEWMENKTQAGNVVREKMASAKAKEHSGVGEQYKEVKREISKRLKSAYPTLTENDALASRFTNMLFSRVWVVQLNNRQNDSDTKLSEHDGMAKTFALMDYRVAVYTFLEVLLSECFYNNYKGQYKDAYTREWTQAESDKLYIYDYVADSHGFSLGGLNRRDGSYATCAAVEKLFTGEKNISRAENASTDSSMRLNLAIIGNLIEAKYDEKHPFNIIKENDASFISMIVNAREARNNSKHGNVAYSRFEYGDWYFRIVDAFNVISGCFPDPKKMPQVSDFTEMKEAEEEFDKAYAAAQEALEKETFAVKNHDAYEQLLCETTSYLLQDVEYVSKLSNLYDVLLQQLICQLSGTAYIEEKMLCKIVTEDSYSPKRAVEIANRYLQSRNTGTEKIFGENIFNCENFGNLVKSLQKKEVELLSTRGKLLYYIICLCVYDKGIWDPTFKSKLRLLIDTTSEVLTKRKHFNEACWEQDEPKFSQWHDTVLDLYKYFTVKIKEYEEKKNGR